MNALLASLAAVGITLTVDGEMLRYTAPAGALTPALREQIAANKPELLALLAAATVPESRQVGAHGPGAGNGQPPSADATPAYPGATRTAPPYRCRYADCGGSAVGPWLAVAADCWQAACSDGHPILRTEYSFQHPPEVRTGRPLPPPPNLPAAPWPLWLFDRVHGVQPATPAPGGLTEGQIATAVGRARGDVDPPAHPSRVVNPPAAREPELVAAILAAGEQRGWPALQLRPGERLAAGERHWRAFAANGPAGRLRDIAGAPGADGGVAS